MKCTVHKKAASHDVKLASCDMLIIEWKVSHDIGVQCHMTLGCVSCDNKSESHQ